MLNEHFVSVKVDREERPDIDAVYMEAVQAITGSGGWPMSVFLTRIKNRSLPGRTSRPNGAPHARLRRDSSGRLRCLEQPPRGGDQAGGQPGFLAASRCVSPGCRRPKTAPSWPNSRQRRPRRSTGRSIPTGADSARRSFLGPSICGCCSASGIDRARQNCLKWRRRLSTGWPPAGSTTISEAASTATAPTRAGSSPTSKMLYDNALLATCYLEAWQITGRPGYQRVARETLDYVLRDMTDERGGFYSSEDADSEGEEGRFYVWTPGEIQEAAGRAPRRRSAGPMESASGATSRAGRS